MSLLKSKVKARQAQNSKELDSKREAIVSFCERNGYALEIKKVLLTDDALKNMALSEDTSLVSILCFDYSNKLIYQGQDATHIDSKTARFMLVKESGDFSRVLIEAFRPGLDQVKVQISPNENESDFNMGMAPDNSMVSHDMSAISPVLGFDCAHYESNYGQHGHSSVLA